MRLLYYVLPFMGAVALASELTLDKCECPLVKCPADDAVKLCQCMNNRETLCKQRCPDYIPKYTPCPMPLPSPIESSISSSASPTPSTSTPTPTPSSKPVPCECIKVSCLQVWPGSCTCANTAALNCYNKCGGVRPKLQPCGEVITEEVAERAPAPQPRAEPECECEGVACIQSWPESCYCGNAAKEACFQKCGGIKPALQECPAQTINTLTTVVSKTKTTKTKTLKSTSTTKATPSPTHKVCGGGRANTNFCDEGYTCIKDPYSPGCGPACDGLGICVKDKMCGGFAGFACEETGQVCVDDERDDCDPKQGGADCGGLCVWPH